MCGICGFTGEDKRTLMAMVKALGHRGPDDKGTFSDGAVSLGHLRLSILDLSSAGHQPMRYKHYVLAFNGEIYNFKEVRFELQSLGHKFSSETDTEVILHAYETWGPKCLEKFNGMFAFAIYDEKKKQLFLARDRFGQKPLYYTHKGNHFAFASEIKALLQYGHYTLNKGIVPYLLTYRYIPSHVPVFHGIEKFKAAHYMLYDLRKRTVLAYERYWSLAYEPKLHISEQQAIRELQEKMEQAVKYTLVADVPVGAFLSGGTDSSIATYHAAKLHPRIKTFSIGSADPDHDESRYAQIVADAYGTDHQTIFIEQKQFLRQLQDMYQHYDTPFLSSSSVALYFLAKEARKKVKVAISGEGGDENFAGYTRYRWFDRISKLPRAAHPVLRVGGKAIAALRPHTRAKVEAALKALKLSDPLRYAKIANYYDEATVKQLLGEVDDEKLFSEYKQYFTNPSRIDNALNADMHIYMEADLLLKLDTSTMAHSLEGRVPFLDHNLAGWIARLPVDHKLRGKQQKYLLKKAYSTVLPKAIVERKKMGFGLPFHEFMGKEGSAIIGDSLHRDAFVFTLVDKHAGQKIVQEFLTLGKHKEDAYTLFQLEQFMKALPGKTI